MAAEDASFLSEGLLASLARSRNILKKENKNIISVYQTTTLGVLPWGKVLFLEPS